MKEVDKILLLPISTPQKHEAQLVRLEILMREQEDSDDMALLVDMIESYDNIHYPEPVYSQEYNYRNSTSRGTYEDMSGR